MVIIANAARVVKEVEDRDSAAARVDERARPRRHSRQPLQEIERRAFADEQRTRGTDDLGDLLAGAARIAVALQRRRADGGIELPERLDGDVESRDDAIGFGEKDAARAQRRIDGRVGRDVAVADIFLQRAPHDVAILGGIKQAARTPAP